MKTDPFREKGSERVTEDSGVTPQDQKETGDWTVTFDAGRKSARFDAGSLDSRLAAGTRLGRYRLVRKLGTGGSAQVWAAERVEDRRRLALKILGAMDLAPRQAIARFVQEGRLAASLSHPHCVLRLRRRGDRGLPTIAMELMAGGSLARYWCATPAGNRAGRGSGRSTSCRVSSAAAAQGIVHR